MRIEYPDYVYAAVVSATASDDVRIIYTEISDNLIADNLNMQVVTYSAL